MKIYQDPKTGYQVRQYTVGPDRNAKHYFSTENFSLDDRYFFFEKTAINDAGVEEYQGLFRAEVETGEITQLTDKHYGKFAMHWTENYGVVAGDDAVIYKINLESGELTRLGAFPQGCTFCGHLTISNDGRVVSAIQQANKIFALCYLDAGQEEATIAFESDQRLGHSQICPTDSNLIFYVHETGGDALQRTWMYDVNYGMSRPYYVEHPNEWITHETWSADGSLMAFMKIPGRILLGDKDGRHFDVVYHAPYRILHPGISHDKKWLCTDAFHGEEGNKDSYWMVELVNPRTGKSVELACTHDCRTGSDHLHPSFNRAGDKILFSNPDENGLAQVCLVDLKQVKM